MPPTITLTPSITTQRRSRNLTLNLSAIFRSQGFKLGLEALTLVSLFTAATLWLIAF